MRACLRPLEFEEPIARPAEGDRGARACCRDRRPERRASIARCDARVDEIRGEIYARLTPWQRVLVARHPNRPYTLDYVERLFTDFAELHGDRRFADDHAIVCRLRALPRRSRSLVVGHQKGRDTKQKIYRNFGYARPEGYRKALRVMQLAEKFRRPIIVFIDTPAAYPGRRIRRARRRRGDRPQPARDDACSTCRSSSSSAARAAAAARSASPIGDRVLMQEFAVYSVIPPEGCAAILWRDAEPQGRGGRGAEDHGARSAGARHHRRRSSRSRSAARTTTTTRPRRSSTRRSARRSPKSQRSTSAAAARRALREVPAHGRDGSGVRRRRRR